VSVTFLFLLFLVYLLVAGN